MRRRPLRAMVLAAGAGRRLRPLTARTAKPALPLMGRPLVEYVLRRLGRMGFEEAVVNLHHLPETVERCLDRADAGLVVHRSLEGELLGTAGGLKKAASFFGDDPLLLVNADTLVDFDLDSLCRAHVDSDALATLLLRPRPAGSLYTSVGVDGRGRVRSLSRSTEDGDWMFAGVWVLESEVFRYLSGDPAGLERELLPRLIEEGAAGSVVQDAPWVTIDTPLHYWSSCLAVARERLFEPDWKVAPRPDLAPEGSSTFVAAGAGTRVEAGGRFGGAVVLGEGCRIGRGAVVESSVLWDGVVVPPRARLRRVVATDGVQVPTGAEMSDRVVMRVGDRRDGLRRREIEGDLVVAPLRTREGTR